MNLYQCDGIATVIMHVKLEAENKQEAANKAHTLFEEKAALVLWESVEGMWTGPEEHQVDLDIDVFKAPNGPDIYWDDGDVIQAKS